MDGFSSTEKIFPFVFHLEHILIAFYASCLKTNQVKSKLSFFQTFLCQREKLLYLVLKLVHCKFSASLWVFPFYLGAVCKPQRPKGWIEREFGLLVSDPDSGNCTWGECLDATDLTSSQKSGKIPRKQGCLATRNKMHEFQSSLLYWNFKVLCVVFDIYLKWVLIFRRKMWCGKSLVIAAQCEVRRPQFLLFDHISVKLMIRLF